MKSLTKMTPSEVIAYIKDKIRYYYSDAVENNSRVYARNGYYFIRFTWKKERLKWILRRRQIKAWVKEIDERGDAEIEE